jgi:hypothetical protein
MSFGDLWWQPWTAPPLDGPSASSERLHLVCVRAREVLTWCHPVTRCPRCAWAAAAGSAQADGWVTDPLARRGSRSPRDTRGIPPDARACGARQRRGLVRSAATPRSARAARSTPRRSAPGRPAQVTGPVGRLRRHSTIASSGLDESVGVRLISSVGLALAAAAVLPLCGHLRSMERSAIRKG